MTPAGTRPLAARHFSAEEIERAGAYHRPIYRYLVARGILGFGFLAVLAFTPVGDRLAGLVDGAPGFGFWFPALVLVLGTVLRLPLSAWRHGHERRAGFSTQGTAAWLGDQAKGLAISALLTGGALWGLSELAAGSPERWPLVAAPVAAAIVVVLSFVAPVVLEPVFNWFRPLEDQALTSRLRALADRAGVPVRRVLVSDASRRTTKHNAYVSGLGATRRVVVFDTLLERGSDRDLELVVAHELGHRRLRHVAKGTATAALGAVAAVGVLWLLLRNEAVLDATRATGAGDPRAVPFVLLSLAVLGLVSDPLGNLISRRWEAAADRFGVELTTDPEGFAAMERALSVENRSDLDPPRLAYLLLFTHPAPAERIEAALSLSPRRGTG
jgi:STE24 endopeptidase